MKKYLQISVLACFLFLATSCTSNENSEKFVCDSTFEVASEGDNKSYNTHGLVDNTLLISEDIIDDDYTTGFRTVRLLALDLKTKKIKTLKEFDYDVRVWDFILVNDEVIFSTISPDELDNLGSRLINIQVVSSHPNTADKVIDQGLIYNFPKSPSFYLYDDVIYYALESFELENNQAVKLHQNVVKYQNLTPEVIYSFDNEVSEYTLEDDYEVMTSTELVKGFNRFGFTTRTPEGSVFYQSIENDKFKNSKISGDIANVLLFSEDFVFDFAELGESEKYNIKSYTMTGYLESKPTQKLPNNMGRLQPNSKESSLVVYNGFPNDESVKSNLEGAYAGIFELKDNKDGSNDLVITTINYEGYDQHAIPFVYRIEHKKFAIVQFDEKENMKISLIKQK